MAIMHEVGSGGFAPAMRGRHAPSLPLSAHDRQPPAQATAQHTPCAQALESHSTSLPHAVPSAFFPQVNVIGSHGCPFSQSNSMSAAHDVRHFAPTASHR